MSTINAVLAIILAVVALLSSAMDFRGTPQIEDLMRRLGRRPKFEHTLGLIKVVGAVGLFVGLAVAWIGIAAAAGFTAYFILAVRAHRSIGDPSKEIAPAGALFLLSAATLVTGLLA